MAQPIHDCWQSIHAAVRLQFITMVLVYAENAVLSREKRKKRNRDREMGGKGGGFSVENCIFMEKQTKL
jgi:hypothetical protein